MTYASAVDRLFALAAELAGPPRKYRLEEMERLCKTLGHPERRFPSVLIAGTNGKGSTAALLASILAAAGYRTGLYTSPHLEQVNERIAISSASGGFEPIADDPFAEAFGKVEAAAVALQHEGSLPAPPSFFEAVTATAFVAFAAARVDIAVLEVGMGGRLDATNVVDPLLSIITDISLDHMEYLGATLDAIAHEKAGILRASGTMVTLPQHPAANRALGEVAASLQVRGVNAAAYIPFLDSTRTGPRNRYPLSVLDETVEVDLPLAGSHQQRNLALAIAAAVELCNTHSYKITPEDISRGIRDIRWPARLERIPHDRHADLLVDVAHNAAGAWALRSALSHFDPAPPAMTLVFSCLRDKEIGEMAQILFPVFDHVILTTVSSPRAASMESLRQAAAAVGTQAMEIPDPAEALDRAWELTSATGLVVAAGSVYLAGAVRKKAMKP